MTKKNKHAVALGRLGGQAKSEAKTAAVRENAKRPRPNAKGKKKPRKEVVVHATARSLTDSQSDTVIDDGQTRRAMRSSSTAGAKDKRPRKKKG